MYAPCATSRLRLRLRLENERPSQAVLGARPSKGERSRSTATRSLPREGGAPLSRINDRDEFRRAPRSDLVMSGVPATMRALRQPSLTGPQHMRLVADASVPAPGPGEVLIRVAAAGVNFAVELGCAASYCNPAVSHAVRASRRACGLWLRAQRRRRLAVAPRRSPPTSRKSARPRSERPQHPRLRPQTTAEGA
jgi:hypothetical protein